MEGRITDATSGNRPTAGKYSVFVDTCRCSWVCELSTASAVDVEQSRTDDAEARSHEFSTS